MYNHSLFYNHLTLPIFGRNKTGHFDNRWEMLYYVVGRSFSLWAPDSTSPPNCNYEVTWAIVSNLGGGAIPKPKGQLPSDGS